MPTPVRRASSGGGSVPPPEPPQGATATIAKTPFFFVATRLRRHFQPWILFSKIAGGKVTVPRLNENNETQELESTGTHGRTAYFSLYFLISYIKPCTAGRAAS